MIATVVEITPDRLTVRVEQNVCMEQVYFLAGHTPDVQVGDCIEVYRQQDNPWLRYGRRRTCRGVPLRRPVLDIDPHGSYT